MPRPALVSATSPPRDAALGRALVAAATVSGVLAELPCRFYVRPGAAGHWIVVVAEAPRDDGHALYVRERSLTAVQRLTLSLWSEGVDAVWEPAPDHETTSAEVDALGVDARHVLGRIWCSAPAGAHAAGAHAAGATAAAA